MNWLSFLDLYKCSVHDNKNLTNIQKLTYLKRQMVGEAHQLIEGCKLGTSYYQHMCYKTHLGSRIE